MGKMNGEFNGQTLHAKSLKFKHPTTEQEMFLEARLPKYFEELLEGLEDDLSCYECKRITDK